MRLFLIYRLVFIFLFNYASADSFNFKDKIVVSSYPITYRAFGTAYRKDSQNPTEKVQLEFLNRIHISPVSTFSLGFAINRNNIVGVSSETSTFPTHLFIRTLLFKKFNCIDRSLNKTGFYIENAISSTNDIIINSGASVSAKYSFRMGMMSRINQNLYFDFCISQAILFYYQSGPIRKELGVGGTISSLFGISYFL
jgi:hypothetical protein